MLEIDKKMKKELEQSNKKLLANFNKKNKWKK